VIFSTLNVESVSAGKKVLTLNGPATSKSREYILSFQNLNIQI